MSVRPTGTEPATVGLLEVVAGELLGDPCLQVQPVHETLVKLRPQLLRDRAVGNVPDQDVVEAERVFARERRGARLDQALARQLEEEAPDRGHIEVRGELEHRAVPELPADDSRTVKHRPFGVAEEIEPARDERVDRRWQGRET